MSNNNNVVSIKDVKTKTRLKEIINRFKTFKNIEKTLEDDKVYLRDLANGETMTHDVPGLGSIQVKKGSEGSSGVSLIFDQTAYEKLDEATKQQLIKAGVVTAKAWTKGPSLPAVVITLNK